ncbi:hypothetical protein TSOC_013370, partial [Tetrabaena socialis]
MSALATATASSAAEGSRWASDAAEAARVAAERERRYRDELARAVQHTPLGYPPHESCTATVTN